MATLRVVEPYMQVLVDQQPQALGRNTRHAEGWEDIKNPRGQTGCRREECVKSYWVNWCKGPCQILQSKLLQRKSVIGSTEDRRTQSCMVNKKHASVNDMRHSLLTRSTNKRDDLGLCGGGGGSAWFLLQFLENPSRMGRYRSRSRSYGPRRSRSPDRRRHYDDPRDRYRSSRSYHDRRSPGPTGLLVRNISLDARPEDLRKPFERYGPVKDVYLPKDYHTGEPRGFGFVKFRNPEDAAEAKDRLNHKIIGGREIAIVFAEENRKTPQEMRRTARISGRNGGSYRRRSPPRSPRHRYRCQFFFAFLASNLFEICKFLVCAYSQSQSPARYRSREKDHKGRDYYSPSRSRSISRSASPSDDKAYKSNHKSTSPRGKRRSSLHERHRGSDTSSPSPRVNDRTPEEKDTEGDQRSPSPWRDGRSLSHSRSLSRTPRSRSRSRSHS
ncbi:RNA recognition motif domain [Dillenia turbinata]|uniref:RNA recognition motif domain n=1 Tax=Dillenia turbinata TaxID=194707 RepID=A0AAN8UH64_9MAGN